MAQIVKIGNSQGLRIPKPIIEQAQLANIELDFTVLEEGLLISPKKTIREDWQAETEAALKSHSLNNEDKEWLGAPLNENDDFEW